MNLAAIVFARMDSRRLPGKALADLDGRPLLGRVLDRVRRTRFPLIVATSERAIDDPIAAFAEAERAPCFRGEAEDVAARAMACLAAHGLDAFIRISGDSPFIDPDVIAAVSDRFIAGPGIDIATNVFPRTYPTGVSAEAIGRAALARILAATAAPEDREHVTRYAYAHPHRFRIANIARAQDASSISLAVDDANDLERTRWMVREGADETAPLETVIALARAFARQRAPVP